MLRFELPAGPTVSLFEQDTQNVVGLFEFAVFDARLTGITFKLQRNNRFGGNEFFNVETGA